VSGSPKLLADFLDATALIEDATLLKSLYPQIQPRLAIASSAPGAAEAKMVSGRYVRIEVPGDFSTVALAEVQVFSGGRNVAPKGTATQASTLGDAAAERAIDGRTDGAWQADTIASTREASNYPWWEVDLGATVPIDQIVVWNRTDGEFGKRLKNYKVRVLDAGRGTVFLSENNTAPERNAAFQVSTGVEQRILRRALLEALVRIPGHESETFATLVNLITEGIDVAPALAAMHRIPSAKWPQQTHAAPTIWRRLVEAIAAHAGTIPAAERNTPEFKQVLEIGTSLAKNAPGGEHLAAQMNALAVQSLVIKTVEAQMKYDVTRFFVEAGRPVEITFENPDIMQHNLVVVQPGSMEEVGRAGDAMGAAGFQRDFIPEKPQVMHHSKLVNPKAKEILRFNAPTHPLITPTSAPSQDTGRS
jgi:azurin